MPGNLTEFKTLLSIQLTLSPCLLALIKKGWELFRRCRLISTFRRKNMQVLGHDKTSRWIGLGPIRLPVIPSKGQSSVLQAIDHSVAGSMTAQPPGSRPSALRVATHGQQVAPLGCLTPLQRCSRHILQLQPIERLSTQHYKVRIKGKVEQSREWISTPPLHLDVVAIEKGAFGSPLIKVSNFTYIISENKFVNDLNFKIQNILSASTIINQNE